MKRLGESEKEPEMGYAKGEEVETFDSDFRTFIQRFFFGTILILRL